MSRNLRFLMEYYYFLAPKLIKMLEYAKQITLINSIKYILTEYGKQVDLKIGSNLILRDPTL